MTNLNILTEKLIPTSALNKLVDKLKSQNKKIVFTNGCFDILHKGHVEYLAQAADLGDVLIVGLNSDDSVRRQEKGKNRPINKINARQTVLSSLFFVDYVVEFNENTPINLIEIILPSVLVKGGDYNPCETNKKNKSYIVGKDIVEKNGGNVQVINLVKGFSTTATIQKMKSTN